MGLKSRVSKIWNVIEINKQNLNKFIAAFCKKIQEKFELISFKFGNLVCNLIRFMVTQVARHTSWIHNSYFNDVFGDSVSG